MQRSDPKGGLKVPRGQVLLDGNAAFRHQVRAQRKPKILFLKPPRKGIKDYKWNQKETQDELRTILDPEQSEFFTGLEVKTEDDTVENFVVGHVFHQPTTVFARPYTGNPNLYHVGVLENDKAKVQGFMFKEDIEQADERFVKYTGPLFGDYILHPSAPSRPHGEIQPIIPPHYPDLESLFTPHMDITDAEESYFPSTPTESTVPPTDPVKQNNFSDCYLLSVIQALAATPEGKDFIYSSMKLLDDETVIVRLFDPITSEPVYLKVNYTYFMQQGQGVVLHKEPWVHIYEQAFAAYATLKTFSTESKETTYQYAFPSFQTIYQGGSSSLAMKMLTGLAAEVHLIEKPKNIFTVDELMEAHIFAVEYKRNNVKIAMDPNDRHPFINDEDYLMWCNFVSSLLNTSEGQKLSEACDTSPKAISDYVLTKLAESKMDVSDTFKQTFHDIQTYSSDQIDLFNQLKALHERKVLMIANTLPLPIAFANKIGLIIKHAYTVTDVYRNAHNQLMIQLKNPHAQTGAQYDRNQPGSPLRVTPHSPFVDIDIGDFIKYFAAYETGCTPEQLLTQLQKQNPSPLPNEEKRMGQIQGSAKEVEIALDKVLSERDHCTDNAKKEILKKIHDSYEETYLKLKEFNDQEEMLLLVKSINQSVNSIRNNRNLEIVLGNLAKNCCEHALSSLEKLIKGDSNKYSALEANRRLLKHLYDNQNYKDIPALTRIIFQVIKTEKDPSPLNEEDLRESIKKAPASFGTTWKWKMLAGFLAIAGIALVVATGGISIAATAATIAIVKGAAAAVAGTATASAAVRTVIEQRRNKRYGLFKQNRIFNKKSEIEMTTTPAYTNKKK